MVLLTALAVFGAGSAGCAAPFASAASGDYEAGFHDGSHDDGLAVKLYKAGSSAKAACRESTLATNVDFPELDIDDLLSRLPRRDGNPVSAADALKLGVTTDRGSTATVTASAATPTDSVKRLVPALLAAASVAAAGLIAPATASAAPADATAVVLGVVDGDTIDIRDDIRGRLRIRVLGIDTPETKKPGYTVGCWGPEATAFAQSNLVDQRVAVETAHPGQDRPIWPDAGLSRSRGRLGLLSRSSGQRRLRARSAVSSSRAALPFGFSLPTSYVNAICQQR